MQDVGNAVTDAVWPLTEALVSFFFLFFEKKKTESTSHFLNTDSCEWIRAERLFPKALMKHVAMWNMQRLQSGNSSVFTADVDERSIRPSDWSSVGSVFHVRHFGDGWKPL